MVALDLEAASPPTPQTRNSTTIQKPERVVRSAMIQTLLDGFGVYEVRIRNSMLTPSFF